MISNRIKHILYLMLGIVLLIIFGFLLYFFLWFPNYLGKKIDSYVTEATANNYELTIGHIYLHPFEKGISISHIELKTKQNQTGISYHLETGEFNLKGIAISKFLKTGNLKIKSISVSHPVLKIFGENQINKTDTSSVNKDLRNKLKSFFTSTIQSVSINSIQLKSAGILQYNKLDQKQPYNSVSRLGVNISDFYIDADLLSNPETIYKAKDVRINIFNFHKLLGDEIHQLAIGEFTYSLKNKGLFAKNIQLSPVSNKVNKHTLYWVKIPEIRLRTESPKDLFLNDTLLIDSLNLLHCQLKIQPPTEHKNINFKKIHEYDLYQLIQNEFNLIKIKHLSFSADSLHILPRIQTSKADQLLKNINVNIDGFSLDSTSYKPSKKILYSDSIDLSIGYYRLNLNDQVHQFTAQNVSASSSGRYIHSGLLTLNPINQGPTLPATVQMSCDSIRLTDVNMIRLFHYREMPLSEIAAFSPKIFINQNSSSAKTTDKNSNNTNLLYQFIKDYIKGVYAHIVSIDDGYFKIKSTPTSDSQDSLSTNFSFKLTDFSLDARSVKRTDKLFFATNIELNFDHYFMQLDDHIHQLEIGNFTVSSFAKKAVIKNLHLHPSPEINNSINSLKRLNHSELYDIKVPELQLLQTDINHAFFRKEIIAKSFEIKRPSIDLKILSKDRPDKQKPDFKEFYSLLHNYITLIKVQQINIPDGKFHIVNEGKKGKIIDFNNHFTLKLGNFILNDQQFNKNRMLFSDYFNLKIKDHLFKLSDNVHVLQAKEINLSSRDSVLSIKQALLYPDITNNNYKKLPWHIKVTIPNIKLFGVDFTQFIYHQKLHVNQFIIDTPKIDFYTNYSKTDKKFNFDNVTVPLPEKLKELTINHLIVNNSSLKVYKLLKNQIHQQAIAKLNLQIDRAQLKRTANRTTARFSCNDITTLVSNLNLTPWNINYLLNVDSIKFSYNQRLLTFNNLLIKSTDKSHSQTIRRIEIPELSFNNLNTETAFTNNHFQAGNILFKSPTFELNQQKKKKSFNPLSVKLPADLTTIMDVLSAEKVDLRNTTFKIYNKQKTFQLKHINLHLENFSLDSIQTQNFLGADRFIFTMDNYHFTDPAHLYNFGIGKFIFNSYNQSIELNHISISPRYSKEAFQSKIAFQQDYYQGEIASIQLQKINLKNWFSNHHLIANKLAINQMNLDIYRDKTKPFNKDQYRPLPQLILPSITTKFRIDTVELKHSNFSYSEKMPKHNGTGTVIFSKTKVDIHPFTNMKLSNNNSANYTYLNAQTNLMDSAQLEVQMRFDRQSQVGAFHVRGSLAPINLESLNPMLENNANVTIRSGQLNQLQFQFDADSLAAKGQMQMGYKNLKIGILEQKNGETKEAHFISFLANSIFIKSQNKLEKDSIPSPINYTRDKQKSIFNYWWKSIFSGIKNVLGIKMDLQPQKPTN